VRPRARYAKGSGVAKIRRDTYGPKWYTTVNEVQQRDDKTCMSCKAVGGTIRHDGSKVKLDTHHAIRLSRGGTTSKANLLTLCDRCHGKRHSHL